MNKFLAVLFSVFLLSGCFEPKTIVGNEFKYVQPNELFEIVVGFNPDGTFYSNAVNGVKGIYQVNEDNLNISINHKTNVVPHQDYVEIEHKYFSDLKKIRTFRLNGNQLNLYTYDGQVMTFNRVGRAQTR